MGNPFIFKSEIWIPRYTGIKIYTLKDFIETLKTVDKFCIFYHMYINIFNYHNLPVYYTNSFSYWFYKNNLLLLAEKLSIIDPLDYYDLEELRNVIVKTLEENLEFEDHERKLVPFYFIKAEREIIETGKTANTLDQFIEGIKESSINSLFYHLVSCKIENKTLVNDYTSWLISIGEAKKGELIDKLDVYVMNLYEIKKEILKILES